MKMPNRNWFDRLLKREVISGTATVAEEKLIIDPLAKMEEGAEDEWDIQALLERPQWAEMRHFERSDRRSPLGSELTFTAKRTQRFD